MKRLILNKKQLFETVVPSLTAAMKNGEPATPQDANTITYAENNPEKVSVALTNVDAPENGPVAQASATTAAIEQMQNPDIKQVNVPQLTGNTSIYETYSKKTVDQMRLNEIKRNGIKLTKRELNEFLNS